MRSGFSLLKWGKKISNPATCLVQDDDELLLLLTFSSLDEVRDRPALPAVLRPHLTLVGVGPPVTPTDGQEDPLTDGAGLGVACLDLHGPAGSLVGLPDGLVWRVAGMLSQFTFIVVRLAVYS